MFFGNRRFCQNRAPAVVGARFSRVGPSKNRSGTRSAAASEKNTVKNGRVALSGAASERSRKIDRRPGGPPGAPKISKRGPREKFLQPLRPTFFDLFAFSSLGGALGGPRDRFSTFCGRFRDDFPVVFGGFRRDLVGVCRVPPGCCRDTPPTSGTHSAGFPLGYGDLAERFKFAVPLRGAGVVLNGSVKSPVPEGLPFLTFPAASARPPYLSH